MFLSKKWNLPMERGGNWDAGKEGEMLSVRVGGFLVGVGVCVSVCGEGGRSILKSICKNHR